MSEPGPIIAVEGPSGSGKSHYAAALARELKAARLLEAYRRLRPRPSLEVHGPRGLLRLEQRLLTEEFRRYRYARSRAATGRTVVADTGFLGPLTYTYGLLALDPRLEDVRPELLARVRRAEKDGRWGLPELTIYLEVPGRVAGERARRAARTHPARYRDRHAEVGRIERAFWLGDYSGRGGPTVWVLDARQPVTKLVRTTILRLRRRPLASASPTAVRRVLARLASRRSRWRSR